MYVYFHKSRKEEREKHVCLYICIYVLTCLSLISIWLNFMIRFTQSALEIGLSNNSQNKQWAINVYTYIYIFFMVILTFICIYIYQLHFKYFMQTTIKTSEITKYSSCLIIFTLIPANYIYQYLLCKTTSIITRNRSKYYKENFRVHNYHRIFVHLSQCSWCKSMNL